MPHIIETALLLVVIFVIGAAAGYGLRALVRRRAPQPGPPPTIDAGGPAAAPRDPVAAQPSAVLGATPATDPAPPVPDGSAAVPASAEVPADDAPVEVPADDEPVVPEPPPADEVPDAPAPPHAPTELENEDVEQPGDPAKGEIAPEAGAGGGDDLKRIRGIGPKIERALNGIGVHRIDQIAGWDEADVARVDAALSLRGRIAREDWVGQARALG